MRLSARQLVNKLLEYGMNPDAPRAGSPDDPWRQTASPLMFDKDTFGGQRPVAPAPEPTEGPEPEPDVEDALDVLLEPPATPGQQPVRPSVHPRFKWLPPTPPGP